VIVITNCGKNRETQLLSQIPDFTRRFAGVASDMASVYPVPRMDNEIDRISKRFYPCAKRLKSFCCIDLLFATWQRKRLGRPVRIADLKEPNHGSHSLYPY
jgi:hypothetical protein